MSFSAFFVFTLTEISTELVVTLSFAVLVKFTKSGLVELANINLFCNDIFLVLFSLIPEAA